MDRFSDISHSRGVTLLEIIVSLVMLLILFCLFSPIWHEWLVASRVDAVVTRLSNAIVFSRHLAIHRGEPITLCGSDNRGDCNGRWNAGYVIKTAHRVVRYYGKLPTGYQLIWRSSLSRDNYLQFTAEGFTDGQQGTFYVCPSKRDQQQTRGLVITRSGRLRYLPAKVYASCSF